MIPTLIHQKKLARKCQDIDELSKLPHSLQENTQFYYDLIKS